MKTIAYVFTIIGTLIGGFQLIETMTFAESAPQQGAGAAMALAWAVLPYCFARAVEKLGAVPFVDALDRYFVRRPPQPTPPLIKQANGINLGSSQRP